MSKDAAPVQSGRVAGHLHVREGGGERCKKTLFDPWAPDCTETVFLPYRFYAVRHGSDWVLIDCGAHPSLAADPGKRLGGQAAFSSVSMAPDDDVLSRIAGLGIAPCDVRHVILTHLHYDHCGGLELLTDAAVHVQCAELAFAEDPPVYQALSYIREDWAGVQRWEVHDGVHDLFGDGAVVMVPTPGHTPGHQSVELDLTGGRFILVGDAAFRPQEMQTRTLPGYLWNPDALLESWDYLEHRRDQVGARLLYSHYPYLDD